VGEKRKGEGKREYNRKKQTPGKREFRKLGILYNIADCILEILR